MGECRARAAPSERPHLAKFCAACRAYLAAAPPTDIERQRVQRLWTPQVHTWGPVRITPGMASCLLALDTCGRRVDRGWVERFTVDIVAGQWTSDPDPILIGHDRGLYNGLLRLCAVVRAQRAVEMSVTSGVDPAAYATIDYRLPMQ